MLQGNFYYLVSGMSIAGQRFFLLEKSQAPKMGTIGSPKNGHSEDLSPIGYKKMDIGLFNRVLLNTVTLTRPTQISEERKK